MRQVVLDTETTGLDPDLGHRIVEVACVEIVNRQLTDRTFHYYLNPERESDEGALKVHGLTSEFLADQPKFAQIADEFLDFVQRAELIIHNAPFDVAFLDKELELTERGKLAQYVESVTDTLRTAKELHPGKRNSLDALCERYGVNNSARVLHGALLDARLLAEVYLSMTRGQDSLAMELTQARDTAQTASEHDAPLQLLVVRASPIEIAEHEAYLEELDKASKGKCLWKSLNSSSPTNA